MGEGGGEEGLERSSRRGNIRVKEALVTGQGYIYMLNKAPQYGLSRHEIVRKYTSCPNSALQSENINSLSLSCHD